MRWQYQRISGQILEFIQRTQKAVQRIFVHQMRHDADIGTDEWQHLIGGDQYVVCCAIEHDHMWRMPTTDQHFIGSAANL